jgi:type II secretory pathway pseudopilin PulG
MVIAIIAILAALLLSGINKVFQLQGRTETLSDITKLAQSLEAAKSGGYQGNLEYLPSRLVLFNNMAKYTPPLIDDTSAVDPSRKALAQQTADVLRRMFGKRILTNPVTVSWGHPDANGRFGVVLEGPECLVFYLGGMSEGGRMVGFAKNPQNPTLSTTASPERYGPFFDFKTTRLQAGTPSPSIVPVPTGGSNGFPRYLDPYGTEYIYFGARAANDYDASHAYKGLAPYFDQNTTPTKWMNPNTYQIISAGRNKVGGTGGGLTVAKDAPARTDDASVDNLTNFSSTELGNAVE